MNDEKFDPLSLLALFGLSRQESSVYVGLLSEGELNGYEAAKNLGLSRSNAYTALASLVDKGAAWIIEGSPTRYKAVPVREFCSSRLRSLEDARDRLVSMLPAKKEETGSYVTIRGRERILDRLRTLVEDSRERVYLSLPGSLLSLLSAELERVVGSGKKLVVITDASCARDLSADPRFVGAKIYPGAVQSGQIRAIADSQYVLTGDLGSGTEPSCLFSDQHNLVELFKSALSNEIRLIELEAGK